MARRPGPSLRALLFGCGAGAVLGQTASFLVGSESDVRHWGSESGPQARSVPQGPAVLAVAEAPFVKFGGWKTAQTASFLVGSESDVRHWGPWPAGPVRPSGPCCFGCGAGAVGEAFGVWKQLKQLVFL